MLFVCLFVSGNPTEEAFHGEPIKFSPEAHVEVCWPVANVDTKETTITDQRSQSEPAEHFPEPRIDPGTGDWILSAFDVECIHIGAGIMGCGGGGSPYIGKLAALEALKAGQEIRVIHPEK